MSKERKGLLKKISQLKKIQMNKNKKQAGAELGQAQYKIG